MISSHKLWRLYIGVGVLLVAVTIGMIATAKGPEPPPETQQLKGVNENNREIMRTLPTPPTTPVNEPASTEDGDLL